VVVAVAPPKGFVQPPTALPAADDEAPIAHIETRSSAPVADCIGHIATSVP
jgi:hypothetical protein